MNEIDRSRRFEFPRSRRLLCSGLGRGSNDLTLRLFLNSDGINVERFEKSQRISGTDCLVLWSMMRCGQMVTAHLR
jgi:hypothetical protein